MLGEKPLPTSSAATGEAAIAPRQKLSIEGIASDDRARIQNLLSKTFTSGGVVEAAQVEKVGLHTLEKTTPKKIAPPEEPDRNQPSEASHMPIIASRNTIASAGQMGHAVGLAVGLALGELLGATLGLCDGLALGEALGLAVGFRT